MTFETPPLQTLRSTLSDPTTPIAKRMRATYYLRQLYDDARSNNDTSSNDKDTDAIVLQTLSQQLTNPSHGSLLRHEFAYVLGQMRDVRALPALHSTLLSVDEDSMIRHECAEALGAIGSLDSVPILRECSVDESVEVGQTCLLALEYIQWKNDNNDDEEEDGNNHVAICACMLSPYNSHDPAPPHPAHVRLTTKEIGSILRDESQPLFQRFRAMFSLRNRADDQSVHELGYTLINDTSSALLRHEVAYVMGQMQHPSSVEYLVMSLQRNGEHKMVRHESAEALGAMEERWGECEKVLKLFLEDEDVVVRESCVVALDAADYFGYSKQKEEDEEKESGEDVGGKGINFSLHKAKMDGRAEGGVLHNHFNIVV